MSSNRAGGGSVGARLPSLDVYKKRISSMFSEDPQTVSRKLDKLVHELRAHRVRVSAIIDLAKFEYAEPIFDVPIEQREDFFEVLETLVDRHGSVLVRVKALQMFLEFGAIEAAAQGEIPFGVTAFTSVGNIMRSSRTIENIFVTQCLMDPLCPIINSMSSGYLGIVAKEIASWIKVTSYPQEFAEGMADCAKKLGKSFQMSLPLAQSWWEKGSDDPEKWAQHAGSNAYNNIAEIIHFTCRSTKVAKMYVPELAIVLYTKTEVFHELIKPSYIKNNLVVPPYKLISALAAAVPEAAAFFAGPNWDKNEVGIESYNYYQQLKSSLNHQRMMKHLSAQVTNITWEEGDASVEPMTAAYYLHTLFSIMSHSSSAVKEFYDEANNVAAIKSLGSSRSFAVQLLKRAEDYAQTSSDLCNAFLRGIVLFTDRHTKRPAELNDFFKELLSDLAISDMSKHLQETAHKLLTTTADQRSDASRSALISICEIYKNFNDPVFSNYIRHITTEHVPNYSRDLILFHILDINGNQNDGGYVLVDDSVRLAASDCLTTLDCNNFSHQGIQYLLDTFSSVPTVISPLKFHVMTTLMFFLFKLAVFEAPDKEQSASAATDDNKQGIDSPGRVFRSLYASEIGNCIFSLLERLVIDGSLDQATYWEIRFVQTCIKFLMTGWIKYEFHADNLGSRPIEILTSIITREQSRLDELMLVFEERKKRYYTLIEQRRCVVSEEDLSLEEDQRVGQAGAYRLPPIRLKRYENVVINTVPYQHSYIEQTSFGSRVSFLFNVLSKLSKIDIVAFRLIHQMCNTICGISMINSIQKLTSMNFDDWNNNDPGKSIQECDKDEQELFHTMPNTSTGGVYTVKTFTFDRNDADGEDANKESKEERNIKRLYVDYMKNMRKDITDAAKGDNSKNIDFKPIYEEYKKSNRVFFAFKIEQQNELIAFCLARPYSNYKSHFPNGLQLKPINGSDVTTEKDLETVHKKSIGHGFIMIDHYYFKPSQKDQMYDAHRALLATLSHSVYQYGFNRCFIVADRHLRPSLAKSGANLVSNSSIVRTDANANDIEVDSSINLFYWYTRDNIWSFSQDHNDYVSNRIPETLLQLLLDDQNTQRIEDMKRQGKMPTKNIVKRFKCKIRNKMEEFGGQLTTEFEGKSETNPITPIIEEILNIDLSGDGNKKDEERQRMFNNLIEKEFKYGLVNESKVGGVKDKDGKEIKDGLGQSVTKYNTNPLWERISGGTKEETLIECVSRITPAAATAPQPLVAAALLSQLPPDLNPRNNPDRYVNDWMRNELAASAREIGEINAGGDGKLLQKDVENELRRRNLELEEQEKSRQNDEIEAEKRRNEWKLPPLLQRWTVPSTAAILRSLFVVLTKSQKTTFDIVLSNLISVPNEGMGILEALRAVLTSFQYQLRASVLDALPESNYNIALKILEIIVASLGRVSSGLNAALASLEYVELCLEVVKDICRLLSGLIQSRNNTYIAAANQGMATVVKGKTASELEASDNTQNGTGSTMAGGSGAISTNGADQSLEKDHNMFKNNIDSSEERVMVGVCKTLSALINQVNYITLFKGSSQLISEGNRKCRQHAQQQLFTSSKVLCDTVLSILLYDLEKENDIDSSETRSKSFASLRDQARVYATELLANFMHVDRSYKYNFFNEFCVANIKADRSIRASFIQQVILRSNSLRFRDKLDPYLRTKNILGSDEYILNFGFPEYSSSDSKTDSDGVKLFIITNQAYYVSHITYDADIESKLLTYLDKDYKMAQFVFVEKRQFSDIIRLYRDFSSHGFAIRSYVDNAKDRLKPDSKVLRKRTDVFLHRSQGMVDNLLQTLANYARDDTYHIHNIATDEFTPAALIPLFQSCLPDGRLQNLTVKLMTHCWVIRRDGTIVKRLMMWVNDNGNHANSSIILTPYSAGNWDPTVGGEELQDIKFSLPWEPAKYPKVTLKEELVPQVSAKCGDTQRIQSLFNVSSASVLPNFMAAMPSLPFGNLSEGGPFHFPVSEIQSVDFTEDQSTDMIIRIRRVDVNRIPSVYVRFADDTGREIWRRELRKLFFGGTMGTWSENILPDLSENSRRKNELL